MEVPHHPSPAGETSLSPDWAAALQESIADVTASIHEATHQTGRSLRAYQTDVADTMVSARAAADGSLRACLVQQEAEGMSTDKVVVSYESSTKEWRIQYTHDALSDPADGNRGWGYLEHMRIRDTTAGLHVVGSDGFIGAAPPAPLPRDVLAANATFYLRKIARELM